MSVRGNTAGEYFGEWFGPVEVVPGAMSASIGGSGGITANLVGIAAEPEKETAGGGGAVSAGVIRRPDFDLFGKPTNPQLTEASIVEKKQVSKDASQEQKSAFPQSDALKEFLKQANEFEFEIENSEDDDLLMILLAAEV